MDGEVCGVCGNAPVFYYSNGVVFCRAHKAEATKLARVGLTAWNAQRSAMAYVDGNGGGTLYNPKGWSGHKLRRGGVKRK